MSEESQSVVAALSAIARRLARSRALEAAAVAAVAAGLCAAALEIAWTIAALHRAWAAAICAGVAGAGPGTLAIRSVRRRLALTGAQAWRAAALCAACGAAGFWAVLGGWHEAVPKAVLPVVLLPGGALAAAGAEMARGVGLTEAAILVDTRCALAERLATAEELARSGAPDTPAAPCVHRQALAAMAEIAPGALPLWRRGRATAGSVALVTLLCLTLTAVPTLGLEAELVRSVEAMSAEARRDLAESLRAAARKARGQADVAEQLQKAARAVEVKDAETLEKIRQALARRGLRLVELVGRDALAAAVASANQGRGGGPGSAGENATGRGRSDRPGRRDPSTRPSDRTNGPSVYVGNPDYARILATQPAESAPAPAPAPADTFVRLDAAWRAARRQGNGLPRAAAHAVARDDLRGNQRRTRTRASWPFRPDTVMSSDPSAMSFEPQSGHSW